MGKEVKLNQSEVEEGGVREEIVAQEENNPTEVIQQDKPKLTPEEINVENSKELRKLLKRVSHIDLLGFIVLFNDNKQKKVGVLSSMDNGITQFVALAHGGYVDKYDQVINQIITTRTVDRMNASRLNDAPKELVENNATEQTEDSQPQSE